MLWRAQRQHVYHICQRCGVRQPLSHMLWQNGLLLCHDSNCIDTAIVGNRDLRVAKAVSIYRRELLPDEKLVTPTSRQNDQLEVMY